MKEAVIVAACRTAVGRAPRGMLRDTRPEFMGTTVLTDLNDECILDIEDAIRINASALAVMVAVAVTFGGGSAFAQGKVIKMIPGGDLKIIDPIQNASYITRNHGYMVYDTLLAVDSNGQVKPQMIDTWTLSPDKKKYTFTLRQGVKFHDGTDFNADAVKFCWDAMLQAKLPSFALVKSVDVVDPLTVKTTLVQWDNTFLANVARGDAAIYCPVGDVPRWSMARASPSMRWETMPALIASSPVPRCISPEIHPSCQSAAIDSSSRRTIRASA